MKCSLCNGRMKVVDGPYSPLLVCTRSRKSKPHPFHPIDKESGEVKSAVCRK